MSIKDEFDLIDEETWKNLLSKALKINSLDEFPARLVQGVLIPSFNHPSTQKLAKYPLDTGPNEWKLGLSIDLEGDNPASAVLMGVENGSEALVLKGKNPDWNFIYKGVYHEMIYNDLSSITGSNVVTDFINYSTASGKTLEALRGAFSLSPDTLKANVDELKKLAKFHYLTIKVESENIPQELARLAFGMQKSIEACIEAGFSSKVIRLSTSVDSHLPVNVSKLRAIRIIWANLLQAYKLPFHPIFLVAKTKVDPAVNKETKLIHNTLASLNAAIGTADLIYADIQEEINSDRLNQNIQHIMKMESKLNMVRDPLAGSYSIEKMSQDLAKAAWSSLTENTSNFE